MVRVKLIVGNRNWPESIDFDQDGNLYFSDDVQKSLFRVKRNENGGLASEPENLLVGLEHAGGIHIDKDNETLYFGVRTSKLGKILQIPLKFFETYTNIDYSSFRKDALENASLRPFEHNIEGSEFATPNGIIFDRKTDSIFYAHTSPKGFVGNSKKLLRKELSLPNGIDVDPTQKSTILAVSLLRNNVIIRLDLNGSSQISSSKFGCGLDGLICLANGDLLVASFFSGKIYHLSWDGKAYYDPRVIIEGLGNPTNMALGRSSDGQGESLFITTTCFLNKIPFLKFLKVGKIVEVEGIGRLLENK